MRGGGFRWVAVVFGSPRLQFASAKHVLWTHGPATGAAHRRGGGGGQTRTTKIGLSVCNSVGLVSARVPVVWVRFRFVFRSCVSCSFRFSFVWVRVRFVFRSLGSVFGSAWFSLVWFGSVRLKPIRFDIVRFDSIRFGSDRQQWNCYLISATGEMSIDK